MSTPYNPYQAPEAKVDDVLEAADAQAEAIRRDHIQQEASIKAVGSLYYLSTIGMLIAGLTSIFMSGSSPSFGTNSTIGGALFLAFAAGMFMVGRGLRKLAPWAKIPTVALSVLGLFGFPFGTLINAYILWLILSKKGRFILSPEYASIVAVTPQVKYRTSIIVWIFLGLILVLLLAAVIVPIFTK